MEVIKKIISLENGKTRADGDLYGTLTATSFFFKIQFTQDVDDMGMFTDFDYIPAPIINRELDMYEKFLRINGTENSHWYMSGDKISGFTDSKVEGVRNYNINTPFLVNFDVERQTYTNFSGETFNAVSRVTSLSGDSIVYTFDAKNDLNVGTTDQNTGILYAENMNSDIISGTSMFFKGEGWNVTNSSLGAISKEEYLMGIINPPEIKNDLFIDRGIVTVMESHLRLSEVENLDHLTRYGNGFYNIVRE